MLLVHRLEQRSKLADALGGAQKQVAAGLQRIVKGWNDLPLQIGAKINQQIAAGHQIHPRERRIADHVMGREDAHLADLLGHHIACAVALEKA